MPAARLGTHTFQWKERKSNVTSVSIETNPMADDPLAGLASLAGFTPARVLHNSLEGKSAAVLGELSGQPAIVRLAREPFDEKSLASGAATHGVSVTPVVRNDVYLRATGVEGAPAAADADAAPSLGIEVICPATEKHIKKYEAQPRLTLVETRAAYEAVTLPAVGATPPSRTAWVDNILNGTAEADRVLTRHPPLAGDSGAGGGGGGGGGVVTVATGDECAAFVLLPDLKWDGADPARLYAVAIFGDPALRSMRDIDRPGRVAAVRAAHTACLAALQAAHGVAPASLRAFFHYHPSYWRLHIHYAAHGVPAADGVGKAHAVDDVLAAAGADPAGWAGRAFTVVLGEGDPLVAGLQAAAGGR